MVNSSLFPAEDGPPTTFARVALAIPVRELFDYRVPPSLEERVVPGARVRVPFGRTTRIGYCVERADESEWEDAKEIAEVLDDEPLVDADLLGLIQWTAEYYLASVGEVMESAIPKAVRDAKPPATIPWVRLHPEADIDALLDPDTPRRGVTRRSREIYTKIVDALRESDALPVRDLLARVGCSRGPVNSLTQRDVLELYSAEPPAESAESAPTASATNASTVNPTPDQVEAIDAITEAIRAPRYETFLLHGVTGSGKTEVYLRAIEATLEEERGALVLLPEIALTPQTVARFEARFGKVAVLHSLLPARERSDEYRRLRDGNPRVAIGARSAIFAPIPDLGLIVVDESHENSYKQESSPRYHGRDLATVRASRLGIPCVLGTATPSLESYENAKGGRYKRLLLPNRVTAHPVAPIEIVDRRSEPPLPRGGGLRLLSPRLERALKETVASGGQAILLLNRRGFARHLHCRSCGFVHRCDQCDIGLTYHKRAGNSQCHYCGTLRPVPETCPDCGVSIRRGGAGTERIEETLSKIVPNVAIGRLDRDTATSRDRLEEILETFRRGHTQILVGTQMVAKGHDIPNVTLVGVIDADIALGLPDFRAAERTFQLLCQVAGRAGRGDRPGTVLVQTRQPEHYAIEAARRQDVSYLYAQEAPTRRLLGYPPFGHLVRVLLEDRDEERVMASAQTLRQQLPGRPSPGAHGTVAPPEVSILGPAPAPLARLRDRYRVHILLKSKRRGALHSLAAFVAEQKPRWSTTRMTIDVDPQSLL